MHVQGRAAGDEAPFSAPGGRLVALERDECLRLLGRGGIGRVAVSVDALPAVFPVNYAMLEEDIVFRTGPGTKLDAAVANCVVAFEIDHNDMMSHTGWSVLAVGNARPIEDPDRLRRAADLPLASWVAGDQDTFVRIETTLLSGRSLTYDGNRDGAAAESTT
jgi:nitroimidazol reductase NimA-like FMN-containing flavoprotein (pyridoxamine 5'-phosphate oxidase superfamily)